MKELETGPVAVTPPGKIRGHVFLLTSKLNCNLRCNFEGHSVNSQIALFGATNHGYEVLFLGWWVGGGAYLKMCVYSCS